VLSKVATQNLKALVPRGSSEADKQQYQREHKNITFEDICSFPLERVSFGSFIGCGSMDPNLQVVDEASATFFKSSVSTSDRKKVVKNFLRTTRGYPCTLSQWAPGGEPGWVVPNARCPVAERGMHFYFLVVPGARNYGRKRFSWNLQALGCPLPSGPGKCQVSD